MGKIVRALSDTGGVLCAALDSTDMVRELSRMHEASRVVTAALGRMTTAAAMMGSMLKYEGDTLTVRINGGGPCGTLTAVSDYRGNVKCSAADAKAAVPLCPDGSLDVPGVVGRDGTLTIIKDMGLKEPYVGQVPLVSGDIALDLTSYYTTSEQLPTVFTLGTLFDDNGSIKAAGGFMLQVVPPISDESVRVLEENLEGMTPIGQMLEEGFTPEKTALAALRGLGGEILDEWEACYRCDCSREKTAGILAALDRTELERLAGEGETTEVCCHFCNKKYRFSAEEILNLLKE